MNKHKYMGYPVKNGEIDNSVPMQHIIGGSLTGWLFADARRQVSCSHCGADPGYHCVTPSGRKAKYPHPERISALVAKTGLTPFEVELV